MKFDHYQRNFLEKRIDFRMKNLNLNYYQDYIEYIRENPVEIDLFLDKFTINYTYFFRNYSIFENFEKFINLYVNNNNHNNKPIRIWSAPCATGDEPYTIAMILDRLKKDNKNLPNFEIVASDIDPRALKVAQDATYGDYSVHDTPEFYLKTYFSKKDTELGPKFILSRDIKNKVEFIQEDIIKGHQKNLKYDIIFCRNFFIYINQFAREKLLRILESRLYDGGLLILGGSETLPHKNSSFESINMRDRFYIKNIFTQNAAFKNKVYNLFKSRMATKIEREKPLKRDKTQSIENKIKEIQRKAQFEEKSESVSKREKISGKELKTEEYINELNELERIEAEVKITGIEVNNGFNGNLSEAQSIKIIESMKNPIENSKISSFKKLERELKQKELILEQREKDLEERITYLDEKYKRIEKKREEVEILFKKVKEQEEEVKNRIEILERLTKQVEQREKLVEQKEKQFEQRIRRIGDYTRQVVQQEAQINGFSKGLIENEEQVNVYEEKRLDRIENPNNKKELKIPMGYYGLINSFDKNEVATKLIMKGLGSGIALILKDPINNIFAMSHISLPSSSASKQGYHLLFPHTFVDTSVKDLYNNLLFNGANSANITALVVGGAKLFLDYDMTYQENIDAVKKQLEINRIVIESEDTGGLSERAVIYDTINDSLYVKKTWEFVYRKLT